MVEQKAPCEHGIIARRDQPIVCGQRNELRVKEPARVIFPGVLPIGTAYCGACEQLRIYGIQDDPSEPQP